MDPQAWRDIYGHGSKGTRGSAPPKHFRRYGAPANGSYNLLQSRDADHARVRRIFSSAFSDRALKQQEPLFNKYVDKLIVTLKRRLAEDPQQKIDMVRMYNFTTFDVMGDLTFGESMHMLDNAEYHPWVSLIFGSVKFGSRTSILHHYPIAARLFRWLVPRSALRKRVEHQKYSGDRVTKRLEKGRDSEGVDLWDLVLSQKEEERLTRGEMDANSSLFMIAGKSGYSCDEHNG
jgi:cytochrome P450